MTKNTKLEIPSIQDCDVLGILDVVQNERIVTSDFDRNKKINSKFKYFSKTSKR